MMSDKRIFWLLIAIVIAGAGLRLYNIGEKSYWVDEEFSVMHSSTSLQELFESSAAETHPPLYYIMLHFWIRLFGDSETATRSLSAIFSILSIFLVYKVGKLLSGKETGLLSAVIFSLSAFHIMQSQEARMYSLIALLALISMYFFILIAIKKESSRRNYIFYFLASVLLIYSHVYGIFIIMAQNIYVIAVRLPWRDFSMKKWVVSQMLLAISFLPWAIILVVQIIGIKNGEFSNLTWIKSPTVENFFDTFMLQASVNVVVIGLLLRFFAARMMKVKRANTEEGDYLLSLWLMVPIMVPFIVSLITVPFYFQKYPIAASFPIYILAAREVIGMKKERIKTILVAAIILLSLIVVIFQYNDYPEPWRETAAYVEGNAEANATVIVMPYYAKYNFDRYSTRTDLNITGEFKGNIEKGTWVIVRYSEVPVGFDINAVNPKARFGRLTAYLSEESEKQK